MMNLLRPSAAKMLRHSRPLDAPAGLVKVLALRGRAKDIFLAP